MFNVNDQDGKIRVDFAADAIPLRNFWNATGYANADFTYVPAFRRVYEYLSSYSNHMVYMRMHNILSLHGQGDRFFLEWKMDYGNRCLEVNNLHNGDDVVVTKDEDGTLRYHWEFVDKVYDILVAHGMRPISELCYLPSSIRKSAEEYYIPENYKVYGQVIQAFVQHCVERYGLDEVRKWYFEIWNEPDNKPKWIQDPSTFLAMYDYAEHAVHSVDSRLRVGGPATMQSDDSYTLFERFLEHCDSEINYCTGAYGTRLDFISVHCKGGQRNSYSASTDIMFEAVKRYTDILKKFPRFKETEFFNDESDIVWAGNAGIWESSWLNFRNTHYAPGFVCKMIGRYCEEVVENGVNLAVADSDNSHLQWERYLFSGNRSQLSPLGTYPTLDVIKKPFFNAYVLLSRLGNKHWKPICDHPDYGKKFGALPTAADEVIAVMVWNFEDGIADDLGERTIHLELQGLRSAKYQMVEYRIDHEHSNANTLWHEMGKPGRPTREQAERLRNAADLETTGPVHTVAVQDGSLSLVLDMPAHAVSLLLLAPQEDKAPAVAQWMKAEVEVGCDGGPQVFLRWEPCADQSFLSYILTRQKNGGPIETICNRLSQNTATYVDMDVQEGDTCVYAVQAVNLSLRRSMTSESVSVSVRPV